MPGTHLFVMRNALVQFNDSANLSTRILCDFETRACDLSPTGEGIVGEHFVKAPAHVYITFPIPISIAHIVVNPRVHGSMSTLFALAVSECAIDTSDARTIPDHNQKSWKPIASYEALPTMTQAVCFSNSQWKDRDWMLSSSLHLATLGTLATRLPQPDLQTYTRVNQVSNGSRLAHVRALRVTLVRPDRGGALALGSVDVWGVPSNNAQHSETDSLLHHLQAVYANTFQSSLGKQPGPGEASSSIFSPLSIFAQQRHDTTRTKDNISTAVADVPLDPITGDPLHDPVRTPSGHILSRSTLVRHVQAFGTDPYTGLALQEDEIVADLAMRARILAVQQGGNMLGVNHEGADHISGIPYQWGQHGLGLAPGTEHSHSQHSSHSHSTSAPYASLAQKRDHNAFTYDLQHGSLLAVGAHASSGRALDSPGLMANLQSHLSLAPEETLSGAPEPVHRANKVRVPHATDGLTTLSTTGKRMRGRDNDDDDDDGDDGVDDVMTANAMGHNRHTGRTSLFPSAGRGTGDSGGGGGRRTLAAGSTHGGILTGSDTERGNSTSSTRWVQGRDSEDARGGKRARSSAAQPSTGSTGDNEDSGGWKETVGRITSPLRRASQHPDIAEVECTVCQKGSSMNTLMFPCRHVVCRSCLLQIPSERQQLIRCPNINCRQLCERRSIVRIYIPTLKG